MEFTLGGGDKMARKTWYEKMGITREDAFGIAILVMLIIGFYLKSRGMI